MSNFNFPLASNPGALAWISEYNGSMQKVSIFCMGIWTGVPLWTTYEGPMLPAILELAASEPFGRSPTISESIPSDTLNSQFYGITKDRGRKQFGTEATGAPERLDSGIADIIRVGFGGYTEWVHSETPGTPAYFSVAVGGISATPGTLLIGIFLPNNEILLYPNRE